MSKADARLREEISTIGAKPSDSAVGSVKKAYSEQLSHAAARAIGAEFRARGLKEARPAPPGVLDSSGAERRMAGGIGAKKVDVTWATEEAGLILAMSIKSINFRDGSSGNFQKNLTNRRGDMLFEGVTLHRRFPYAVLGGLFFLDRAAASDGTLKRNSTFVNAHARFGMFTGRSDPAGREEQFEALYIALIDAQVESPCVDMFRVGQPDNTIGIDQVICDLLKLVAFRNPDFYEFADGKLKRVRG